jgi:N-methylhydantoinase A
VAVQSAEDGRISAHTQDIHEAFTREYDRTFGHTMDERVEIVSVRATLRIPLPRRAEEHIRHATEPDGRHPRSLEAFSFTGGRRLPFRLVDRSTLGADTEIKGPAIILEETATTYLDAEFIARVHPSGTLFIADLGRS